MDRPDVPLAWRLAIASVGVFLLLSASTGDGPAAINPLLFVVAGAVLAVGMLRGDARDRWAAAGGVGIALLFGLLLSSPFGVLLGLGIGVPAALVASRPHALATPIVALGAAVTVLALRVIVGVDTPDDADTRARGWVLTGSLLVTAAGLLLYAVLAKSAPLPPMTRRVRLALAAAGAASLAISWATGGHFTFLPLWPFALALLVLPALGAWRAFPAGALVVGGVALVGAFPAGSCALEPWSDAFVPSTWAASRHDALVLIAFAGGNGPAWATGDGFSGMRAHCPPSVIVLGVLWDLALVGTATWAAAARSHA